MDSNVHGNFVLILPVFIDSLKFYTDHVTEKVCSRFNRLSILIKLDYNDKTNNKYYKNAQTLRSLPTGRQESLREPVVRMRTPNNIGSAAPKR